MSSHDGCRKIGPFPDYGEAPMRLRLTCKQCGEPVDEYVARFWLNDAYHPACYDEMADDEAAREAEEDSRYDHEREGLS